MSTLGQITDCDAAERAGRFWGQWEVLREYGLRALEAEPAGEAMRAFARLEDAAPRLITFAMRKPLATITLMSAALGEALEGREVGAPIMAVWGRLLDAVGALPESLDGEDDRAGWTIGWAAERVALWTIARELPALDALAA